MTIDPTQLLRQLGQTGRAGAIQGAGAGQGQKAHASEFADLLGRARDGTLASNKPVSIEEGSGVKLTDEQLARLSLAADRAEAAGLRRALVTIDDQRIILDVQERKIVGQARAESGVLEGIDGVIDLAGTLAPAEPRAATVQPPSGLDNPAVARMLSDISKRERAG